MKITHLWNAIELNLWVAWNHAYWTLAPRHEPQNSFTPRAFHPLSIVRPFFTFVSLALPLHADFLYHRLHGKFKKGSWLDVLSSEKLVPASTSPSGTRLFCGTYFLLFSRLDFFNLFILQPLSQYSTEPIMSQKYPFIQQCTSIRAFRPSLRFTLKLCYQWRFFFLRPGTPFTDRVNQIVYGTCSFFLSSL